jgi:hypothetical protein
MRYSNAFARKSWLRTASIIFFVMFFCSLSYTYAQTKINDTSKVQPMHAARIKPKVILHRRFVYQLEAQLVGAVLGLSKQQTDSLIVVYREARKNRKMELNKYPDKQDKEYFTIAQEINSKERLKFLASLKRFITETQANEAIITLGSFNQNWDNDINLLTSFNLDQEKMDTAMHLLYSYIVDLEKGMKISEGKSSHRISRDLKNNLDIKMERLLTEKQYVVWKDVTNKEGKKVPAEK